eukprot:snap_masked-scaffold_75-processed-gene-0.30-mRNA-1 protein AED:1.00 eAED:1.00 QI:0/-1/0/0/-1/1/1/0/156
MQVSTKQQKDNQSELQADTKTFCPSLPVLLVVLYIITCAIYGVSVVISGNLDLGISSPSMRNPTLSPSFSPSHSPTASPSFIPAGPPRSPAEVLCDEKPTSDVDLIVCATARRLIFCGADGGADIEFCTCNCNINEFVIATDSEDPCSETACEVFV